MTYESNCIYCNSEPKGTVTILPQRKQKWAGNADGNDFMSLNMGLRFGLSRDNINYIWGNSMRGDCVDLWGEGRV